MSTFELKRDEIASLMRRIGVPSDEVPASVEGTGTWLLDKWRETDVFCCVVVQSDHDYVWDVQWSYSYDKPIDTKHLDFLASGSFSNFDEAIYSAAAEAFGVRHCDSRFIRKREVTYREQAKESKDSIQRNIDGFFSKREQDSLN